jgi:hypothetical protein
VEFPGLIRLAATNRRPACFLHAVVAYHITPVSSRASTTDLQVSSHLVARIYDPAAADLLRIARVQGSVGSFGDASRPVGRRSTVRRCEIEPAESIGEYRRRSSSAVARRCYAGFRTRRGPANADRASFDAGSARDRPATPRCLTPRLPPGHTRRVSVCGAQARAHRECSRSLLLQLSSRANTDYPLTLSRTCSVPLTWS